MKKGEVKSFVKNPGSAQNDKRADRIFKTPTSFNTNALKLTPKIGVGSCKYQTPKGCSISKSRSSPAISEKYMNSIKTKEKFFGTPVTHLCSPSLSPKGRRHFIQHNSCSVKMFLSDSNLHESPLKNHGEITTPSSGGSQQDEETSNFIVGVRVRPFNLRELSDPDVRNVVQMNEEEVEVTCDTGAVHSFTYDHCFWSFDTTHSQYASQETVFNTMVLPLMDQIFLGCNACLLAYGQTGSGKSYSMMGIDSGIVGEPGKESGIIPRFFHELFQRIGVIEENGGNCHAEISYFEIYNEKIHDLLGNHSNFSLRKSLKVREHPTYGPYVVDLSAHCVKSFQDVQDWITVGNSQRITAATGMNEKSSRSHSIFSIMITQKQHDNNIYSCKSKVNLVDLAGSERVAQTCATGNKLKEGVSINKSLLSLGKVITFLSEKGRRKGITSFGPYRESVLTWLLRESLGGNSRTAMLATISPANIHLDETLATLRYACQARSIVNRVYKNEDANERVIRELRAEVEKITMLRQELDKMKKMVEYTENQEKQQEIDRLKKQLFDSEQLLAKSQLTWAERLQEAEDLKAAELRYLKRCGVAIGLQCDSQIPCLVNLAADPILTGTLLYLLPPGRLVIGRSSQENSMENKPDIVLTGPLIHPHHCEVENVNGRLFLKPIENCDTYVNGQLIKKEIELKHKDRVVFGGIHYFRVSIPNESEKSSGEVVDFDYAHQEILKIQEERLRNELEESKQTAIAKLEAEMESMLGAQKFDYERQINEMISVVEMQTNALVEERKQKNVLEMERNVLQQRVNSQGNCLDIINNGQKNARKISPYKSTFLKDLKNIFGEKNVDAHSECCTEKTNLHEMQLMVQEAKQRCKGLNLNYEFHQQLVVGAGSFNPVVKVVNKDIGMFIFWDPQKFLTFINLLRESDKADIEKMLTDTSLKWEADESEAKENVISVNTDYFKKRLSRNLQQKKDVTVLGGDTIPENILICLEEIKARVEKLKWISSNNNGDEKWQERLRDAMKHLEMFFNAMQFGNSRNGVPCDNETSFEDKNEKCVRFSVLP